MYSVLSENGLGTVIATSSFGASPIQEIPNRSQWSEANRYYWTTVVPALVEPMSHGDVLVMINDLSDFAPATMSQEVANQLSVLKVGLDRLSRTMAAKGVQLIFQSQNPLMRDAECPPDKGKMQWFNSQSTRRCHYYSKMETIRRLLPLRQVLDQVRSNRNFHVLDLLSVMCPGDLCTLQNDEGVFLYRDIFSHPSIEANRLARPLFLSSVEEATTHDALQAR
jgi:hypothetical protein